MSEFSPDWLRLREGADLAARDPVLARRFAAALPRPKTRAVRLLDLGAGTGANCRALLPRIAGDQDWLLIEREPLLIAAQAGEFTAWARRQGYPIRAGGGRIEITVGAARWTLCGVALDLARDLGRLATLGADGVAAASLFDLVSREFVMELTILLARLRLPLLAALTLDGRREWRPEHAEDAIVGRAFRRHQAGDKGFGPALGGDAAEALAKALAKNGFSVSATASDWQLGGNRAILAELIAGEAAAARAAAPEQEPAIAAWQKSRLAELLNGKLTLTIGHSDTLALSA